MSFVNVMRQVADNPSSTDGAVHLLMTGRQVKLMAGDSERVIEKINLQATQFSQVLEGILQEPHGQPRWGLNE